MPDYILTKRINDKTGQLPDKLCIRLSLRDAWLLLKQIMLQIEQGKQEIFLEIYGRVERK